ncbi:SigE family RNA polymerase sigma factor [Kitasatospora sp. NBC_01246]|uniref:SigE family RNA polymerase sigma factor n=1 Tax=Kitasatospora sp. NBC_01246 TaxID=2903570 RepID=UPI002E370CA8|nr:SigE family RNA polymerase sigma factor [Kitasatospora sp. NBC_01246]
MDHSTSAEQPAEPVPPDFPAFAVSRGRHLLRTAFLLTGGDAHLAEDLLQEALGRIFVKWRRISRLDNPSGYAQTVLVNTFLSYRRRRSSSERVTDTLPDIAVDGPDPTLRLTLLRALGELPAQDRAVLVLRFWEDRSVEETAAALRLSSTAVRSRSSRALARMRATLGESLGADGQAAGGGSTGGDTGGRTTTDPTGRKAALGRVL